MFTLPENSCGIAIYKLEASLYLANMLDLADPLLTGESPH